MNIFAKKHRYEVFRISLLSRPSITVSRILQTDKIQSIGDLTTCWFWISSLATIKTLIAEVCLIWRMRITWIIFCPCMVMFSVGNRGEEGPTFTDVSFVNSSPLDHTDTGPRTSTHKKPRNKAVHLWVDIQKSWVHKAPCTGPRKRLPLHQW